MADNWNKLKNVASKAIGEKMKVRMNGCWEGIAVVDMYSYMFF